MSKPPQSLSPREPMVDANGLPTRNWWRLIDSLIGQSGKTAAPLTVKANAIFNDGTLTNGGTISSPELPAGSLIGNAGTVLAQPAIVPIGGGLATSNGTLVAAPLAPMSLAGNAGTVTATPGGIAIGDNLTLTAGTLSATATATDDETLLYSIRDTRGQAATLEGDLADAMTLAMLPSRQDVSSGGAETFTFTQVAPLATWTVDHDLDRFPSVAVVDSTGNMVEGDVIYTDANTITLSFAGAFSGIAYLN